MPEKPPVYQKLLPHLFRQEYAKMTAVLCRHFGLVHMETAEDIASETFLKASENWAVHGVPDNPTAWLYAVAKNKAKDYFKHLSVFEKKIKNEIESESYPLHQELEFSEEIISDSQLVMIFTVCNPSNPQESQICLALQILCGFSVEEIANTFLIKKETVKKRLQRARAVLRKDGFQVQALDGDKVRSRLDVVLKILYLLFNEGYHSRSDDEVIRKDLCLEATRLTLILADHPITDTPKVNALLALMCFQSSRLEARKDHDGGVLLYEEQDRRLWDKELIEKGNYFLVEACSGEEISPYHLEAGIAYWHTTPAAEDKWQRILHLYDQLVGMEYSPMAALNRVFAFAQVHGKEAAVKESEKLNLMESPYYHALLGYLYEGHHIQKGIFHYQKTLNLTSSEAEKKTISKALERLRKIQPRSK